MQPDEKAINLQWYPGHMAKAKRALIEHLSKVDVAVELCDARLPLGSRNPDLEEIFQKKPHVLVLNKSDLADEARTKQWLSYFRERGDIALAITATRNVAKPLEAAILRAAKPAIERMEKKGAKKIVRALVAGIPNVGKSTLINALNGAAVAKTGDRPGVTRGGQWVHVSPYLDIWDMPGLLWPKLEDQTAARRLAFLGTIRDAILDEEKLAGMLLHDLLEVSPELVKGRYRIEGTEDDLLEAVCKKRGFLLSGGRFDTARGAAVVLDEFRGGKLGRITLEMPPVREQNRPKLGQTLEEDAP